MVTEDFCTIYPAELDLKTFVETIRESKFFAQSSKVIEHFYVQVSLIN
ncbi:hypothetical protein P7H59_00955 [Enterococcus viikkiensis]|uniref:Uncharacterized protein n=1 Tax=Enterococcus viikkiensis TaxID=930854 RepID=A0ABU3FM31_9ENTE|nr:hypothetical protein [Enterococcus viikkiensis]